MKDILNVLESTNIKRKEKVEFAKKELSQMTLPERAHVLNGMIAMSEKDEEITDEEKKILDKINLSVDQKILAWGYIVKNIQEAQELIDNENEHYKKKIEDNKRRSQVLQNRINSRITYIGQLMHEFGKLRIEGSNYSVKFKKQQDELIFDTNADNIDWSKYPDNLYDKVPASNKPKKKELKNYLKENKSNDFSMNAKPMILEVK
jgi:hypothetical protein